MISAQKIKDLRMKTGAGMMDCKKALTEVNGDLEEAIDWLRKKGINTAQKKSDRNASDGLITINFEDNKACILEINSETDFVARNEDFQNFCFKISKTILSNNLSSVDEINNSQMFDSKLSVSNELTSIISKIGENIIIKRFNFLERKPNLHFQHYIHNSVNKYSGKMGVLLCLNVTDNRNEINDFSKNLCMHIAALDPKSIDVDDLDIKTIEREKSIIGEQLNASNKPQEIQKKIVEGRINKFFEEVCLLKQTFVMDNKKTVGEYINSFNKDNNLDVSVNRFITYKVGEI